MAERIGHHHGTRRDKAAAFVKDVLGPLVGFSSSLIQVLIAIATPFVAGSFLGIAVSPLIGVCVFLLILVVLLLRAQIKTRKELDAARADIDALAASYARNELELELTEVIEQTQLGFGEKVHVLYAEVKNLGPGSSFTGRLDNFDGLSVFSGYSASIYWKANEKPLIRIEGRGDTRQLRVGSVGVTSRKISFHDATEGRGRSFEPTEGQSTDLQFDIEIRNTKHKGKPFIQPVRLTVPEEAENLRFEKI